MNAGSGHRRPKLVILDFDGTLVESVGIKDQAFHDLYSGYPGQLDEIMAYHTSHNHTVRFEKFRHIHTQILGLEYTDEARSELSRRFSDLVFRKIVECPWVAGAQDFLAFCRSAGIPMYLVSMSPKEELERILEARGIGDSFERVYASPWGKREAMADIIGREGIAAGDAVYVGDAPEDGHAAEDAGVRFFGRDSGRSLAGVTGMVFEDMDGVKRELEGAERVG